MSRTSLYLSAASFCLLSACASIQNPNKRPVSADNMDTISKLPTVIVENKQGIGSSWTYVSSAGATAQYGLVGGLVGGIIDAIVNAGPAARAEKTATEINKVVTPANLNEASLSAFKNLASAGDNHKQPIMVGNAKEPQLDNLKIVYSYALSEDASVLRVTAETSVESKTLKYKSPYSGKSPSKGPVYKNTFSYFSDPFQVPTLNDEIKKQLVAQITARYTTANGKLPDAKSDDFKKYTKEIEQANDSELSKSEASAFLIGKWTANNGLAAQTVINQAHSLLSKYIVQDLTNPAVPDIKGTDKVIESLSGGRVVKLIGASVEAGSIISAPATGPTPTWGNTVSFADSNIDKVKKDNKEQKKAKNSKKSGKKSSES